MRRKIMKKIVLITAYVTIVFGIWLGATLADGWFWISNWISWIDVPWTTDPSANDEAILIIVKVANRILSLLSVIAIIMFLIWWYKVLTAWWDDAKVKWWYKIIKNAIIWLLIIWLTRAMIRLIFWFVNWMVWVHDFDSDG